MNQYKSEVTEVLDHSFTPMLR